MLVEIEVTDIKGGFIYGKYIYREKGILSGTFKISIKNGDIYVDIEDTPRVLPYAICQVYTGYKEGKVSVGWRKDFLYT